MTESAPAYPVPLAAFCRAIEQHAIISITDVAGTILYINPLFCKLSGYGYEELIGQNHRVVRSSQQNPEVLEAMWETVSAGNTWHGELCHLHKCGRPYWLQATVVPLVDGDGVPSHYISTYTDITAQKQQLLRIQEMSRELNELLRLAPFGIARLQQRRITLVNPAFAGILGYGQDELIGCSTRAIYFSDTQFEEAGAMAYVPMMQGEMVKMELELRAKDGRTVWCVAGTCSLSQDDPTMDTLFMIQDISEHKQLEARLAATAEQAFSAEAAKATFIDIMTHQLRTPLNAILGSGQIVEHSLDDAELKSLLAISNNSARALLHMVELALGYTELEQAPLSDHPHQCVLEECVAAALWKSAPLAKDGAVTLINDVNTPTGAFEFRTDMKMFSQLLELVVDNAIRFNRRGGTVTLSVTFESDPIQPGSAFVLSIADSGRGMTPEQVAHIADPFLRFASEGDGSGLGMALCQRLAGKLQARLDVASEPGRGTTVRIMMPGSR